MLLVLQLLSHDAVYMIEPVTIPSAVSRNLTTYFRHTPLFRPREHIKCRVRSP